MFLHNEYPHTHIGCNYNDFYCLPLPYSNYGINVYGETLNLISMLQIAVNINTWGYLYSRVWSGDNTTSFTIHRMLAHIFLPVNNIPNAVVNHINGIKTDNSISNLEWVTVADNVRHSIRTGLQHINKPAILTNVVSGDTIEANSLKEACMVADINYKRLHRSHSENITKPYLGKWVYKYKSEN
jgi:hypothetical protein